MTEKIYTFSRDLPILVQQLNNNVNKNMLIVFGTCSAIFDGRVKLSVDSADRVLILKKDLSLLLHGPAGVKPVQWQKSRAGKVSFRVTSDNNLQMETYRPKTDESFFVTFTKVYKALMFDAKDMAVASLTGNEKDLVDYLTENPGDIEEGLSIIDLEKSTDFGILDIFARDRTGKLVVIEVKKQNATLADAHQLKRYIDYFKKQGQD
ncbi:MAG: endonuclease NucS domain-containing protein, partial [Candidatus Odinarchaeota archaeon]